MKKEGASRVEGGTTLKNQATPAKQIRNRQQKAIPQPGDPDFISPPLTRSTLKRQDLTDQANNDPGLKSKLNRTNPFLETTPPKMRRLNQDMDLRSSELRAVDDDSISNISSSSRRSIDFANSTIEEEMQHCFGHINLADLPPELTASLKANLLAVREQRALNNSQVGSSSDEKDAGSEVPEGTGAGADVQDALSASGLASVADRVPTPFPTHDNPGSSENDLIDLGQGSSGAVANTGPSSSSTPGPTGPPKPVLPRPSPGNPFVSQPQPNPDQQPAAPVDPAGRADSGSSNPLGGGGDPGAVVAPVLNQGVVVVAQVAQPAAEDVDPDPEEVPVIAPGAGARPAARDLPPAVVPRVPAVLPVASKAGEAFPKQYDNPTKVGIASVSLVGVKPLITATPQPMAAQTLLAGVWACLAGQRDLVRVEDRQVTITGTISLPNFQGNCPLAYIQSRWTKLVDDNEVPELLVINGDKGEKVGQVVEGYLERYRPAEVVNAKEVVNVLKGKHALENELAHRVVPLLSAGHSNFDLTSLFMTCFLMVDYLYFLERNNIVWGVPGNLAECIDVVNINANAAGVGPAYEAIARQVMNFRIAVPGASLTALDLACLRLITYGPRYVGLGQQPAYPVHHYMRVPAVAWTVWLRGALQLPAQAVVTAAEMAAFTHKLARLIATPDMLVRGYIQAQTIVNGVIYRQGNRDSVFFTSSLEVLRISVPLAQGRNMVWDLLEVMWTNDIDPNHFTRESDVIVGCTLEELVAVGGATAGIISLGFSAAFHHVNITGRNLTAWVRAQNVPVRQFLMQLLSRPPHGNIVPIYGAVATAVTTATGLTLHPYTWRSSDWCGGSAGRGPVARLQLWEGAFARKIPYLIRPESMEWLIRDWLAEWGFNGANPTFNATREMVCHGPQGAQGVYIYRGDTKYYEIRQSHTPYLYCPYGAFFFNVIAQHYRLLHLPAWAFRVLQGSSRTEVFESAELEVGAAWQPRYTAAIHSLEAGTLVTYDWDLDRVLAPVLLRAGIQPRTWVIWSRLPDETIPTYAGFVSRHASPYSDMILNNYDVCRMFPSAIVGQDPLATQANDSARRGEN